MRIFALGASTLLGFPNPLNTSFPHFLELMLADAYPEKRFEVFNCGITAINTFCLLDFVDELVDYEPDLIVLYSGHNEFVGPYGVTTPFLRMGNDRTWIRCFMFLQRSRIYYYLKEGIHQVREWLRPAAAEEGFGLHLFDREISPQHPGYRITGENYRANLEEMLRTAERHQVPVLLSTLVSNLHFYPFRSTCDLSRMALKVAALERQNRLPEAIQVGEETLAQAPECANIHYELGRLHYRQGAYEQAHRHLARARDLDRLPFRAPGPFNQTIRDLVRDRPGVLLADSERALSAAAGHGIIGNDLITEYLHPTVYGHYLMARTMLEELVQQGADRNWGAADTTRLQPYQSYAERLGYGPGEQVFYRTDLMLFLSRMPYQEPPTILRRYVAQLMYRQIQEFYQLTPPQRQTFALKSQPVLVRLLDFLLPEDRQVLAGMLQSLESR